MHEHGTRCDIAKSKVRVFKSAEKGHIADGSMNLSCQRSAAWGCCIVCSGVHAEGNGNKGSNANGVVVVGQDGWEQWRQHRRVQKIRQPSLRSVARWTWMLGTEGTDQALVNNWHGSNCNVVFVALPLMGLSVSWGRVNFENEAIMLLWTSNGQKWVV